MTFDKAVDREGHHRGAPLTEDEKNARTLMLWREAQRVSMPLLRKAELTASLVDELDRQRDRLKAINSAVTQRHGRFVLRVTEEEARTVLETIDHR